jgi:hypothetical protein
MSWGRGLRVVGPYPLPQTPSPNPLHFILLTTSPNRLCHSEPPQAAKNLYFSLLRVTNKKPLPDDRIFP